MGVVVTFNPANFQAEFPEFANVPTARLNMLATLATQTVFDNTGAGPVNDPNYALQLLNLLVAHLLTLFGPSVTAAGTLGGNSQSPGQPLGRLESASQGSVSASYGYNVPTSPSGPWFQQTQYGAMYWMATAQFRSFVYVPSGCSGTGYAVDYLYPTYNIPGGV
jgi:hypothetical protein